MVTITIDNGENMDKTHFADLHELMAYLNRTPEDVLSEANPSLKTELEHRDKEMDEDPSSSIASVKDVTDYARKGE